MIHSILNGRLKKEFNVFEVVSGYWGQKYYSATFKDREVTVDDFSEEIIICLATPPINNEPGEVVKSWVFPNEDQAISFIQTEHLLM